MQFINKATTTKKDNGRGKKNRYKQCKMQERKLNIF